MQQPKRIVEGQRFIRRMDMTKQGSYSHCNICYTFQKAMPTFTFLPASFSGSTLVRQLFLWVVFITLSNTDEGTGEAAACMCHLVQ